MSPGITLPTIQNGHQRLGAVSRATTGSGPSRLLGPSGTGRPRPGKAPEPTDFNRYVQPEEVERLLHVICLLDRTWASKRLSRVTSAARPASVPFPGR